MRLNKREIKNIVELKFSVGDHINSNKYIRVIIKGSKLSSQKL